MNEQKKIIMIVTLTIFLIISVYILSYFLLVFEACGGAQGFGQYDISYPEYRFSIPNYIFKPIHELDRSWIRPSKWEKILKPEPVSEKSILILKELEQNINNDN